MEDRALVESSGLTTLKEAMLSTLIEALGEAEEDAREGGGGGTKEGREEKSRGGEVPDGGEGEGHSDGDASACNDAFDEPWERETVMRVISQLTESSPPHSPVAVAVAVPFGAGRSESRTSSWREELELAFEIMLLSGPRRKLVGSRKSHPMQLIMPFGSPCIRCRSIWLKKKNYFLFSSLKLL